VGKSNPLFIVAIQPLTTLLLEVAKAGTKLSLAPLEKHLPAGCMIDMLLSNSHWHGACRFAVQYLAIIYYYCAFDTP